MHCVNVVVSPVVVGVPEQASMLRHLLKLPTAPIAAGLRKATTPGGYFCPFNQHSGRHAIAWNSRGNSNTAIAKTATTRHNRAHRERSRPGSWRRGARYVGISTRRNSERVEKDARQRISQMEE